MRGTEGPIPIDKAIAEAAEEKDKAVEGFATAVDKFELYTASTKIDKAVEKRDEIDNLLDKKNHKKR